MSSKKSFNPPRRGTPGRLEGGGTRARDNEKQVPPDPTNPDGSSHRESF